MKPSKLPAEKEKFRAQKNVFKLVNTEHNYVKMHILEIKKKK